MDVKTAIRTRRAINKFDPEFSITQADIDELLSLTELSPTAFNIQHWRFVVVRDRQLRAQIRAAAWIKHKSRMPRYW